MYDFKNQVVNKLLVVLACFIGFIIFTIVLPGVVSTILIVAFLWAFCGLTGWSMGRMSGDISNEENVPFYKETAFYEHIARGPITLMKYFN